MPLQVQPPRRPLAHTGSATGSRRKAGASRAGDGGDVIVTEGPGPGVTVRVIRRRRHGGVETRPGSRWPPARRSRCQCLTLSLSAVATVTRDSRACRGPKKGSKNLGLGEAMARMRATPAWRQVLQSLAGMYPHCQ